MRCQNVCRCLSTLFKDALYLFIAVKSMKANNGLHESKRANTDRKHEGEKSVTHTQSLCNAGCNERLGERRRLFNCKNTVAEKVPTQKLPISPEISFVADPPTPRRQSIEIVHSDECGPCSQWKGG